MEVSGYAHDPAGLPSGKNLVTHFIGGRGLAGLDDTENFAPTGIRCLERSAHKPVDKPTTLSWWRLNHVCLSVCLVAYQLLGLRVIE